MTILFLSDAVLSK